MAKRLSFDVNVNYLDGKRMDEMLSTPEGKKLLSLAKNISACLHEDWKENLVREKGVSYQHFRDVRDEERKQQILADKEEILLVQKLLETNADAITEEQRKKYLSEDGKLLYKIDKQLKKDENGQEKEVEVAMFDLIRVPFVNLTQHWQDANLDAAKFALCLVKTCLDKGDLDGSHAEIFQAFENMAHDVHEYWVSQNSWADEKLMLPYELLTVDTPGYNEKDKDRDKVKKTTVALTNQSNIPERNRSIVVRAVIELMNDKSASSGLSPEYLERLEQIAPLIEQQNKRDYDRYLKNKNKVQDVAQRVFKGKKRIEFADLEVMSDTYFEDWKREVSLFMDLPEELKCAYKDVEFADIRVNHKNIARGEVLKIIYDLEQEKKLPKIPLEKEIKSRIKESNEKDYAAYLKKKEQAQVQHQPGNE